MDDLFPFVLAMIALTATPGPTNLALAATGASFGSRSSAGLLVGALMGMIVIQVLTGSGVAGVVLAFPGVAPVLGLLASAYMLYLAWRIATSPPPRTEPSELSAQGTQARAPSLPSGLAITLGNPKAYVAMTALYSGYTFVPGRPGWDFAAKFAVLLCMIPPIQFLWLSVGGSIARFSATPRRHRTISVGFAAALICSVALALLL